VAGLGEQGEGVGAQARNESDRYISQGGKERKEKNGLCAAGARGCRRRMTCMGLVYRGWVCGANGIG